MPTRVTFRRFVREVIILLILAFAFIFIVTVYIRGEFVSLAFLGIIVLSIMTPKPELDTDPVQVSPKGIRIFKYFRSIQIGIAIIALILLWVPLFDVEGTVICLILLILGDGAYAGLLYNNINREEREYDAEV